MPEKDSPSIMDNDTVREAASQAVGMGAFVGLLLLLAVLLIVETAGILSFGIPMAFYALIAIAALFVGSLNDTSVIPEQ